MEITVIASGSNGNSCLVEEKGVSLLIDAGKSCRETEARLNRQGKSLENVDALLITHSHVDHICGADVISRKYNIPIYATKGTQREAAIGGYCVKQFPRDSTFFIKGLTIRPVQTSHDVTSCGFTVGKFGIFTDTGIVTEQMQNIIPKLEAVLIESNHDIDMVLKGPYPIFLKHRILSDSGHLSNIHASQLVAEKGKNLSLVMLGHLSAINNTEELARKTFETIVKRKIEYAVCSRDKETGSWSV
ncbi:MAG: MBL fold metallo-hydrolase [Candidatus Woesearchaeota archaeon]